MTTRELIGKLKRVEHNRGGEHGEYWTALCPGHDDRKPSLSISQGPDGRTLMTCHAGCNVAAIMGELGLTVADLFPEKHKRNGNGAHPQGRGDIIDTYEYLDEQRNLLFQVVRLEPKSFRQRRPDQKGGWAWGLGDVRRVLYRLPEITDAVRAGRTVLVVEGEKDADRLAQLGLVATTCAMGAGKWRAEYSESLRGGNVIILPDNDDAGREHARDVARSLFAVAKSVRIIELPGLPPKGDVSDWLNAGHSADELRKLGRSAPVLSAPPAAPEAIVMHDSDTREPVSSEPEPPQLPQLPDEFWTARPVLERIRQAAHARNRSALAVLHCVLARVAAFRAPAVEIDTGIGAPASLNYFVALVDPSGAGKSSPERIARMLVDAPRDYGLPDPLPLGSGEGLAEAYMGTRDRRREEDGENKKVRAQVRYHAFCYAAEGQSFLALQERNGTTIAEALRRGWTGEMLGQYNATQERTRVVNNYSLGLVIAFQPATILPLFADVGAGTPQRFIFAGCTDPSVPDEPPAWPGSLNLNIYGSHHSYTIDRDICRQLRAEDTARVRGQVRPDPLNAHEPLHLLKLAGLLCTLDCRTHVDAEDWRLAQVLWETSRATRSLLLGYARLLQRAKQRRETREHVARSLAADRALKGEDVDVDRVARLIARAVWRADGPLTRRDATSAANSRDRKLTSRAIACAARARWITESEDGRLAPGLEKP